MKKAAFHSSGRLDIEMYINRFRVQRFVFTADDESFDVTGFTWNLNIKQNVGALTNYVSLSLGAGLSYPTYEENILEARFQAAQLTPTLIKGEGVKYWELIRTDTNEIWLSGEATFKYGMLDSGGSDQDVTVNLLNDTISVELQGLVFVTGSDSGGGGGASLTDWAITSGAPTGVIPNGSRYYLTGAAGVILGEAVAEGTTMEARIPNPTVRADWYFNFGGT